MHDWTSIVRAYLTSLGPTAAGDRDLVEELAAHLAQCYDEARADGRSDEEARAHAAKVLEQSALLRALIQARRAPLPKRIVQWSRQ